MRKIKRCPELYLTIINGNKIIFTSQQN